MRKVTDEEARRHDRRRKKTTSNQDWTSPTDDAARITRMKNGTTRLAYKAERVVDMETGAVEMWTRGDRYYVGEPSFIPRLGGDCSDDGWFLAMCFDAAAAASEAVVLDAQRIADGPVATLKLREKVPHGLHGHWTSECHNAPAPRLQTLEEE
jgi:carotenoid cleavage dioxygenase-like enzyme